MRNRSSAPIARPYSLLRLTPLAALLAGFLAASLPSDAAAVCIAPDQAGTAVVPAIGCPFLSDPLDPFRIVLSPTAEIKIDVEILPLTLVSSAPGGSLGGTISIHEIDITLDMTGEGDLAGFSRFMHMFVPNLQTDHGPQPAGDPFQVFPTDMFILSGEIFGDPDFDFLRLRAGTGLGLPSPGQTTLTRLGPPGSDFQVDSFFDVFYEIDYQGAPGSLLEGFSGTSSDVARVELEVPLPEPSTLLLVGLALGALALRRGAP